MSRNPYLAASRPSSSYTRSSRSSKRNDGPSMLGRSRSSATLAGLSNQLGGTSSYSHAAGYLPSSSSTSWQRPSTTSSVTNRSLNRTDSNRSSEYASSISKPLYKSASSQNLATGLRSLNRDRDNHESCDTQDEHLKNYHQTKTLEYEARKPSSSSRTSTEDKSISRGLSNLSLDSSGTELNYERDSETSGSSAPQSYIKNELSKSHSLDISQYQQQAADTSFLYSSMSVDRLLLKSETMTEKELRKSFKELALENDCLRKQLKGSDEREKHRQQDWLRKERQMQRKISELEEENKQLERWREEIRRLKEENTSLLRVVNKLSKQN